MAEENAELSLEQSMDATMDSLSETETTAPAAAPTGTGDSISPAAGASPAAPSASPPAGSPPEPTSDFPKAWRKELSAKWSALDPEVRQEVIKRESDVLKGITGYKEAAEYSQRFHETVKPFMNTIQQFAGGDPLVAVKALMHADHTMRYSNPQDKAVYFQNLARQYGVDLSLVGGQPSQPVDPLVQALINDVTQVKGYLTQTQLRQQQEQQASITKEVDTFADDTAHPYFNELTEDITKLVQAGYPLKDAYERAVWSNPVTRQKELNRTQEESVKATAEKARKETEAAAKASSTNVRGRDSKRTPTEPLGSIEDTMHQTLAEIRARV